VLAAAARRFVVALGVLSVGTAVVSLALGALAGASVDRSVSLGLYLVGSFLLIGAFFVGNRGPLRSIGDRGGLFSAFGRKGVRKATQEERREEVNAAVVYMSVGLLLIVFGVLIDNRFTLV
jgi:hypothetical protein